jgi:hypothetical protein
MKSTKISNLLFIFLIGLTVAYFGASIYENITSRLINIYLNTALAILLLDLALFFWSLNFKKRLEPKSKLMPVPALVAARTVALAMAASRTGALVAGFYLGVSLFFIPYLDNPQISQRLTNSAISTLVSIWLLILGLRLERICQVPGYLDDDESTGN